MAGVDDSHKHTPLLNRERSDKLYADARKLMPGGVSSPVRSFNAVGSTPFFAASGSGAEIVDADGNRYIDLVQSWGALLFGHAHPAVVDAVTDAARRGTSFGTPSELEVELARLVTSMIPGADRVRFVSSGTEAGMTAVRLARGITKRNKIIKFEGCYHGHSDALLASAGSGMATLGIPGTPGVTPAAVNDTIVVPYNDTDALDAAVAEHGSEVAAILVEPVAANMGLVLPREGWLEDVARAAKSCEALLIFDEVITGFRLDPGGAQERFGIEADLVMLGKILGGGLPAAAVAGRASIMEALAPEGPIYQAGTLSGNPLAMAAGIATLGLIRSDPDIYARLQETGRSLARAFVDAAEHAQVHPMVAASIGALSGFFFSEDEVDDFAGAQASDGEAYARFFAGMLSHGVYLPPSRFEALFVSTALTEEHVDRIAHAAAHVLTEI